MKSLHLYANLIDNLDAPSLKLNAMYHDWFVENGYEYVIVKLKDEYSLEVSDEVYIHLKLAEMIHRTSR